MTPIDSAIGRAGGKRVRQQPYRRPRRYRRAGEEVDGVERSLIFDLRSKLLPCRPTPGPRDVRPLLKFSGGSVHDYATFSTAGFSQLTNHGTPNRSTSMPNRSAQKVSAMG